MRKTVLPLILICSFATFHAAHAAEEDMRTGSFGGYWCGMKARFDITQRQGKTWVFNGKVLIEATKEYDKIRVEQMEDNGLQMDRFLTGEYAGKKQSARTAPPKTSLHNGVGLLAFSTRGRSNNDPAHSWSGIGCTGNSHVFVPIK